MTHFDNDPDSQLLSNKQPDSQISSLSSLIAPNHQQTVLEAHAIRFEQHIIQTVDSIFQFSTAQPAEWAFAIHIHGEPYDSTLQDMPPGQSHSHFIDYRAMGSKMMALDSKALIFCHSHPFGDPQPSGKDRYSTRFLLQFCAVLGVQLVDHLIFAPTGHFSFREAGLL